MQTAGGMPEFPDRPPLEFAADRECKLPDLGPTLQDAWQRSRETITRMKEIFAATPLPSAVQTIYVCGSIGRMEMLPNSDCDLVIVTDDSVWPDSDEARQLHADIWQQLEPLGMVRPKADGIFSETVTWGQLTDRSTRGLVDENQFIYGKRIQLLLDSQPVAFAQQFDTLQFQVVKRLCRAFVSNRAVVDWTPLINEVIRYWKALEVRTAWMEDPGEWRYLNVKLRHSRQLIIAGLLLSLCLTVEAFSQFTEGDLNANEDVRTAGEIGFLQAHLRKTPFELIYTVSAEVSPATPRTLQTNYELFLKRMSDEEFVARLGDPAIKELNTPEYLELNENATQFSTVIHQVLRQQAEKCPPHVRQALML